MNQANLSAAPTDRLINAGEACYAVVGTNRSVLHAASWLQAMNASLFGAADIGEATRSTASPLAILIAGDSLPHVPDTDEGPTRIYFWDFEVGRPGVGAFASAVSGVSSVIGNPHGPPGVLPVHLPEQWTGMFGASLALGLKFAVAKDAVRPRRIDVSAADILRAFAEQNSGNHAGVPYGWRRNGRTAVEHGGVFPQGFFACRDGYVAVQARSKQDWRAILNALGNPNWSEDENFRNPFRLSEDDTVILPKFEAELMTRERQELLELAIAFGAPMAPVLTPEEAASWDVFRPGYSDDASSPNLPFVITR